MVAYMELNRPKVMGLSQWLLVSINILILWHSNVFAASIKSKLIGDFGAEEIAIDEAERILERGGILSMKKSQELAANPELFLGNPKLVEEIMPFAVGPKDPRFYIPASILRGEMYPLYEDHPNNLQYPMGPMHYMPHLTQQYKQYNYNPPFNQYNHQQPHRNEYYDPPFYYNRQISGNPVHGYGDWINHKPQDTVQNHPLQPQQEPNVPVEEAVNFMKQSHHFAQPSNYVMHSVNEPQYYMSDFYFVALVAGCTAVAVCAVLGFGICYYRLNKSKRDASDAEYPAYGVTGPNKDLSPGSADRKLAQSAHMYHYQHQKQQMIAAEKSSADERHCSTSDVDSEEEGDEGHYTVYECPGLAPTGEMEVKNPLFSDDPTPASPGLITENVTK